MVAMAPHDWKLVGPWYRWPREGLPADGRLSVPEIQKYAHSGFVKAFLEEPQHCLQFDPDKDYRSKPGQIAEGSGLVGKLGQVIEAAKTWAGQRAQARVSFRKDRLAEARLTPSGLLKLYQPVHERFYIVVAELHCDTGGFPSPAREAVCQAGFVLRRRSTLVERDDAKAIEERLEGLRRAQAALAEVRGQGPLKNAMKAARERVIAELKAQGRLEAEVAARKAAVEAARQSLSEWMQGKDYATRLQRWVGLDATDPTARAGEWRDIPAEAGKADAEHLADGSAREHVIPMRRVHSAGPDHDAEGRALYFGVIPTTSVQHDLTGNPRLDDTSVYEIRCFVRRRRLDCARLPGDAGCRGDLVWSAPTRAFCIAPVMDLEGMANRPVTIRMPDLAELQAQVTTAADPGRFAALGFDQPQQLLPRDGTIPGQQTDPKLAAICFFPIPLITIVALFLLNLFLPIILFIFNLWWMLAMKFCIPPLVKFDMDLAILDQIDPELDLSLETDLQVTVDGVSTSLGGLLDQQLAPMAPELPLTFEAKVAMATAARQLAPPPGQTPRNGRSGRYLEQDFYPKVQPKWMPVVVPAARPPGAALRRRETAS